MSELLRPAARAALHRWGEVLILAALAATLGWWGWGTLGVPRWLAWALALVLLGLGFGAVQRARFAPGVGGPGVVSLVEREIRYFGPRGGGFAALDAILVLSLSADGAFWLIETVEGQILAVPRAAEGAEVLFDAFAALPGLDMDRLLRIAAQNPARRARVIWRRSGLPLLT